MTRRRWTLILAALASLSLLTAAAVGGAAARPARYPIKVADVPEADFMKPGRELIIMSERPGLPQQLAYYVQYQGRYLRVDDQKDLVGQVDIRSEKQALAYVRIVPSREHWQEMLPASQASGRFGGMSGDELNKFLVEDDRPGKEKVRCLEVLTDEEWKANQLSDAAVSRCGDRFLVKRWVHAFHIGESYVVSQLSEAVSRDGRLERKVIQEKKLVGVVLYTGGRG